MVAESPWSRRLTLVLVPLVYPVLCRLAVRGNGWLDSPDPEICSMMADALALNLALSRARIFSGGSLHASRRQNFQLRGPYHHLARQVFWPNLNILRPIRVDMMNRIRADRMAVNRARVNARNSRHCGLRRSESSASDTLILLISVQKPGVGLCCRGPWWNSLPSEVISTQGAFGLSMLASSFFNPDKEVASIHAVPILRRVTPKSSRRSGMTPS